MGLISDSLDRARKLEDSTLVARHLFDNPMILLASPGYLVQHGEPQETADLKRHNCLVFSNPKSINVWQFSRDGKEFTVPVKGNFQSDNGDVLLEVALSGGGLVQLPNWMVDEHINTGRLQQVLGEYSGQNLPFNAIYPQTRYVPLKVRCFIDFMKRKLADSNRFK